MDTLVTINEWVGEQVKQGKTLEELDRTFFLMEENRIAELQLLKNGHVQVVIHSKPYVVDLKGNQKTRQKKASLLHELKLQTEEHKKLVKSRYEGAVYAIPYHELDAFKGDRLVECTVKTVDLQEDVVEMVYVDEDGQEMWEALSIAQFEKHAIPK